MIVIFVVLEINIITGYTIKTCSFFNVYDRKFATAHGKTQNYKRGKKKVVTRNWPLNILLWPVWMMVFMDSHSML